MKYLDLQYLKDNVTMIHAFGLGFIQIKLKNGNRVHVYTDRVKKTTGEEEIHDHRYGFISLVAKGKLTNDIFCLTSGDTHILTTENCKPESDKAHGAEVLCGIEQLVSTEMTTGTTYHMNANTLHRVSTTFAVTVLKRGQIEKDLARVVRPKDEALTCPFSVNLPEEELWKIVKEELEREN